MIIRPVSKDSSLECSSRPWGFELLHAYIRPEKEMHGRRQAADGRRQTADGRRQTADGRPQTAYGVRRTADGRRQRPYNASRVASRCRKRSGYHARAGLSWSGEGDGAGVELAICAAPATHGAVNTDGRPTERGLSAKRILVCRPLHCNSAAETALQPLMWCSESLSSHPYSPELFSQAPEYTTIRRCP